METPEESKLTQFVKYLLDKGVDGVGPLSSAQKLADEYLNDKSYVNHESRIDSLINWETTKNFTSGFVTGLGGLITLPISIPAAVGASWIIQARMVAAIAIIGGHDIKSDRVRTLVLLSLLGGAGNEVLKEAGVRIGTGLATAALKQLPGKALIEINKRVGFRLLTKAGQTGIINFTKLLPIFGGVVAGSVDAISCQMIGITAKKTFFCEVMPKSDSSSHH